MLWTADPFCINIWTLTEILWAYMQWRREGGVLGVLGPPQSVRLIIFSLAKKTEDYSCFKSTSKTYIGST